MEITRNKKLEDEVYAKLIDRETLDSQRGADIHVSDLQYLRKAYWQRVAPMPPTRDEIGYWLAGRAHHFILVYAFTGVSATEEQRFYDEELGIHYAPDLPSIHGEFKTSRWMIVPYNKESALQSLQYYTDQCRRYAALMKTTTWNLLVLYLVGKDAMLDSEGVPLRTKSNHIKTYKRSRVPLKCYTLEFTHEELEETKREISHKSSLLQQALQEKDHTALETCPKPICYSTKGRGQHKEIVPICKWFQQCQPLQEKSNNVE